MRKIIILVGLILLNSIFGYAGQNNSEISVSIEKGKYWSHKYNIWGLIPITITPQIAVWLEDSQGNLIKTISVTEKSQKIERERALPVWTNRQKKTEDKIITSASPAGNAYYESNLATESRIFVEINNSFDYNENYTKEGSGVDGQPSLIYSARVSPDKKGEYELDPIGHSGTGKKLGKIIKQLESLTTALEIANQVSVTIR